MRSPILGVYAGQVKAHGKFGDYVHNALGMWRSFGLVPFLLYIGLALAAVVTAAKRVIIEGADDPRWHFMLYVSVFCLLLIVGAKSIYWPLPALAWGLALRSKEGATHLPANVQLLPL
jgi:hypothetical protein